MQVEKIIAVLVLYKTTLNESASFKTLLNSIQNSGLSLKLVVYNNSPGYWKYGQEKFDGLEIIYIEDHLNSGVSRAYNVGLNYAVKYQKEYILLLDQDTHLHEAFFESFFEAEEKYLDSGAGLFCPMMMNVDELLSPAKFFLFTSRKLGSISPGLHDLEGLAIINSGLLISTQLFGTVGGYNENIELDFSDFDFLKRSLNFTNKIIILNIECQHTLSSEGEVSKQSALNRFGYYLKGARHYNKTYPDAVGLAIWVFLRAVKLNVKYKTTNFTTKIINFIIKGI